MHILKIERRYFVFDKHTIKHLLEKIKNLGTYSLDTKPTKKTVLDLYFDSPNKLLEDNGLILRKRILGAKSILKLKRRFEMPEFFYYDGIRQHEREKEINTSDPLSKHLFFLNNALNSMFSSGLKIDTDNIFKSLEVILTIKHKHKIYKVFGYGGLKIEVRHQKMYIKNFQTKRKNKTEIIEIKMVSAENTHQLFEDFIKRIEKHCKEIVYTKDSRLEMALRLTKPLPTRAEKKALLEAKKKAEEQGE